MSSKLKHPSLGYQPFLTKFRILGELREEL